MRQVRTLSSVIANFKLYHQRHIKLSEVILSFYKYPYWTLDILFHNILYFIYNYIFSTLKIIFLRLRPVIFSEMDNDKEYINNSMTIGTGLFELYIALQSIAK